MGGIVQTVTGPINAQDLGVVHLHEHVLSDFTCYMPADRTDWDQSTIELRTYTDHRMGATTKHNLTLGNLDEAQAELLAFKAAGGSTVVDSTSIGIGRNPTGLKEVSERTGVNIVMGAGWYIDASLPASFDARSVGDLAEEIIEDLTIGVGNTGVRAGLIGEVGLSWPHTDRELRSLEAAALAQGATGAALQIHPGRNRQSPMDAVLACESWGADPSRIVMSHVERTLTAHEEMVALARTGCVLEFDLFGQESSYYFDPGFTDMPNDAGRIRAIKGLIDAGHGQQIAISQDICQRTHTAAFGGEGLHHILTRAVPLMTRLGLTTADIDALLRHTPARILAPHPERLQ